MNCELASERLPELLAGALGRDTELAVLAHLARCESCRRELAFWAQLQQAVRQEVGEVPSRIIRDVRAGLFHPEQASALEGLWTAGRALSLAGSACRLALAAAGVK